MHLNIQDTIYRRVERTTWQEDQGWLQFTYLQYLEEVMGHKMPFNCAKVGNS